ncbi:hypothetical protein [Dyadobacter sp. BHUBP1]|uniref:hypothetical protein n=1 Tax=Dyadobacter sp. BHUBP1 TaxID=3424178 RepID=UPI003D353C16
MDPRMTNQLITGDINGVPFKSAITVEMGAVVKKDWCDKIVVAMSLVRKISEKEYQMVILNYFHAKQGEFAPTDSVVLHRQNSMCFQDSINISSYFKSFPGNDMKMDSYRLLEGPWNHFKILYYDPEKNEIQGQFAAKFVRINKHQLAKEAGDTITYTNGKFIVSNVYVQEVFTEPR